MPTDKRIPRALNSDLDNKAIDKTSALDALNLYSGPDNEGFSADGKKSDAGDQVLKNIRGNVAINEVDSLPLGGRLIGSVEDPKTDVTYLFFYSSGASQQGIWAYDRFGRLPGSQENSIRLIYKSTQFNFPSNGFVKADIVYSNAVKSTESEDVDFDKDVIIYFTDGVNEPRKINAYRALQAGQNIHGGDIYAEADFITACPKTPLKPITFDFAFDPSRSTSNFTTTPGFQFAYQYVYIDGMESSISPYSDVAYPPSVIFQGAQSFVNHNNYNECRLRIPLPLPLASNEIVSVKVLAKQGAAGSFLIIDELDFGDVDADNVDFDLENETIVYSFYNDKIGRGISQDEVNKQFDAVPLRAESQSVSSNRLMYGNYTDGFDAVKTQCSAEVIYKTSPQDFLTFNVKVNPSIEPIGQPGPGVTNLGKSVGFVLDFSEMPTTLEEGAELSLSVTIAPDRNWHVYRYRNSGLDISGYHQTRQQGIQTQEGIDNAYNNVNFQQSLAQTNEEAGTTFGPLVAVRSMFGDSPGVKPPTQSWNCVATTLTEIGTQNTLGQSATTAYGTSAANPVVLKGGAVNFFAKLKTTEPIGGDVANKVNRAFKKTLLGLGEEPGFEVVLDSSGNPEVRSQDSYNINVGLNSGQRIKQDNIRSESNTTDSEARLISAVNTYGFNLATPPGGYFIVNKANVVIDLQEVGDSNYPFIPEHESHYRLRLKQANDLDIYTCLHATTDDPDVMHPLDWIAISRDDLLLIQDGQLTFQNWLGSKGFDTTLKFHQKPGVDFVGLAAGETATIVSQTIAKQIGLFQSNILFDFTDELCLLDGEGGPGGGPSNQAGSEDNAYDYWKLYNQGTVTVNPHITDGTIVYGLVAFYTGQIGLFSIPGTTISNTPLATTLPLLFMVSVNAVGENEFSFVLPDALETNTDIINPAFPNFKRLQSPAEIVSNSFSLSTLDQLQARSFKTEANHDFGIVYYDERGRHGFVNPLKTVFVEGYTDAERQEDGGKGRVEIKLTLEHDPPSWAHQYKIAYSKNTSVQDFVQYNAGGGFVSGNLEEQEIAESNQNVYVSLNYLQGNPISYVSSFGARTPEGGLNLYKYQEGDKLRVISYFEGEERKYVDHEFDVVDLVKLGETDNPLSDGINPAEGVDESLKGDFVVLKNNPLAFGFTHGDVLSGTSKWNNNCIIELRTPLKDAEAEQRIFYEMSETYDVVVDADGNLVHDQEELILTKGDVFFRPVATNTREFEGGQYVDLIFETDDAGDPPPQPNFKNVFLETATATDLFRADNIGLGRPNFIFKDAKETIREATITYSDPSNPEGKKLNYSSFNSSLANFKDLPERFGDIKYMSDYDEFLFVLQEDKVSVVPVNKSILSDASGSKMVIASTEILGKAVFYPGQNGCSDASSVFDSGQEAYFCNKTLSKVYRWTKASGVEEISDKGMSSVIRASLQRAMEKSGDLRIVGGYDPLKDEYLFTIVNLMPRPDNVGEPVVQPDQVLPPPPPPPPGPEGDDETEDFEEDELTPEIEVPDSVDFGSISSDSGKQAKEYIIFNNGTADLLVQDIRVNQPYLTISPSTVSGQEPFYIAPGQKESVTVAFDPEGLEGVITGKVSVLHSIGLAKNINVVDSAVIAVVTLVSPDTSDLSDFGQTINGFYLQNPDITPPPQFPLTNDDQMSIELAFQYIQDNVALQIEESETGVAEGTSYQQFSDFLLPFSSGTRKRFALLALDMAQEAVNTPGDGTLGVSELLTYLEAYGGTIDLSGNWNSALVAGTPPPFSGAPPASGGDTPPELGVPPPSLNNIFASDQEAVDFINSSADMNLGQLQALNIFVLPRVRHDLDGDGQIGTMDLIQFLTVFGNSISTDPSTLVFINPSAPPEESGGDAGSSLQTTSNAILYLLINGTMTSAQYLSVMANVSLEFKADFNQDGVITQEDHLSLLAFWTEGVAQGDAFTPYDGPALIV
jgi:hypothetical protein|tara:strand:- start:1037 stop:6883 length:5847 start_codon:yes stop_codon:yes gene_type:complete